ncbi:MAG TPA: class I SAM-dependent methyltransferase [Ignavibacteriaceae bacterium]|nr:class I SAM-dependent methyltransferase [Ignavibacterium sp.]HRN26832.1 class I SAM-dependent methyltransferase [Ignavibacteriaceae bacterium]HRP93224.1 class I SAM-dependent methyltransferase [Ignavibacteriaceae bacterium]HRQ54429.1 class I SAM-dependent methyltransferase [Ignavibacteriaceae bacterium]
MNIQSAYNKWSSSYDEDKNLTRDLDAEIVRNEFANIKFDSILEIGCGTGKNTNFFSEIADKVNAIDFSEGMILKAKEKIKSGNVQFTQADIIHKLPIETSTIELVACSLILEHIENLDFIFSEANRCLKKKGKIFINELHPFRQYEGKKATFINDGKTTVIDAFVHNISDFTNAAINNGFKLLKLNEFWHKLDKNKLPRILSLLFVKDN